MWIEIPDDICDYLKKIRMPMDQAVLSVNTLLDSMLKGYHIVYMSRKTIEWFLNWDFINITNKNLLEWVLGKYIYIYECKNIISKKIIIDLKSKDICINKKNYTVPLTYFVDIRECKLLTENESDYKTFVRIFDSVKHYKGLSEMFYINYENDSCHGGNAGSKLEQSANDNRFSLCLLDSDIEYAGGARGATFRGANKVYKKYCSSHVIGIATLGVREKENLFPFEYYRPIFNKCDFFMKMANYTFDEKEQKYLDIKDGIKLKRYKDPRWSECFKRIHELVSELLIENSVEDEDTVIIEGIGEKACDKLQELLFCSEDIFQEVVGKYGLSASERDKIIKYRNNLIELLPDYLSDEWEKIFMLLFEWGCSLSKYNLPYYKNL